MTAAFKAWSLSLQKTKVGQLFENDPHPINLLVSAIKISSLDAQPLRVSVKKLVSFLHVNTAG